MSYFDDLQDAALDIIIEFDYENCALYRYDTTEANRDGFNKELKRESQYTKQIRVGFARGNTIANVEYIGETYEKDIQTGDVIQYFDDRNKLKKFTVINFEPVRNHTLLELAQVNDGNTN